LPDEKKPRKPRKKEYTEFDLYDSPVLSPECLSPDEDRFISNLIMLGDPGKAWRATFQKGNWNWPVRECQERGMAMMRRWAVNRKLNKLFEESDLDKKLVIRKTVEGMVDGADKNAQVQYVKLGAAILKLTDPTMDLNITARTTEQLRDEVAKIIKDGNKPDESKPKS